MGAVLKNIRKLIKSRRNRKKGVEERRVYFFCEKKTGTIRFKIEAGANGKLPEDQAASLLAMHCLVRRQAPVDYVALVVAEERVIEEVGGRAQQLLEAGLAISAPAPLSRREQEVLCGVLRNLANKEIAAQLSLSERTVKFHVSSLLAKFRVRSRVGLMQEAAHLLPSSLPLNTILCSGSPVGSLTPSREELCSETERRGAGPRGQPEILPARA